MTRIVVNNQKENLAKYANEHQKLYKAFQFVLYMLGWTGLTTTVILCTSNHHHHIALYK